MGNWYCLLLPLIFVAIVAYVYRPWAKKRYEKDAEIPFEDKDDVADQQNKQD